MNIAQFAAGYTERAERLRRLKDDANSMGAFIQRLRLEHEAMCEEIAMLEDHIAKDNASGTVVMPVPKGADDDDGINTPCARAA
jgi:hypothetical protein